MCVRVCVSTHRNRELVELLGQGFGIHHAGMLRPDRGLTERMFADGIIKVSVCVCVCVCACVWGGAGGERELVN